MCYIPGTENAHEDHMSFVCKHIHPFNACQRQEYLHSNDSRLDQLEEQGDKDDMLVPIRLEIELDGYKLRDTFTWNLNGIISILKGRMLLAHHYSPL